MAHRPAKHTRRRRGGRLILLLILLLCGLLYFYPEPVRKITALAPQPVQEMIQTSHTRIRNGVGAALDKLQALLKSLGISLPGFQDELAASGTDDFEIHYLDVGEGLSVLVRTGKAALLYDGGDSDASSFVVSYLQGQGITHLDYVIASHYDSDHLSGLVGVLNKFTAGTVMGPDYAYNSWTYESFLRAVDGSGLALTHPAVGSVYELGDAAFTVLAPREVAEEPNNNSLVIRIVNGDNGFLLTGDAQTESEEAMCASNLSLLSDVLCVGHHGSYNATSELFLDYVLPEYAVISCGVGNDYGHPHQQTLRRLEKHGVTVLRTDELGTIIARSDGSTVTWEYEKRAT